MIEKAKRIPPLAVLGALLALAIPVSAKSVKDFEAMPAAEQSAYLSGFLQKMTTDLGRQNPELARRIKDYFVRSRPRKPFSEGLEDVSVELVVVDKLAKQGEVDLSKIEIKGVVVTVTKRQFAGGCRKSRSGKQGQYSDVAFKTFLGCRCRLLENFLNLQPLGTPRRIECSTVAAARELSCACALRSIMVSLILEQLHCGANSKRRLSVKLQPDQLSYQAPSSSPEFVVTHTIVFVVHQARSRSETRCRRELGIH